MSATTEVWLGYKLAGGRLEIDPTEIDNNIAVVGSGARDVTACLVHSMVESSFRVAVVDIGGGLAGVLSGYVDSYDATYVMHDSMLVDGEKAQLHARLLASAYSTVLNLPDWQDDLLNAALQEMALEEGEASPMGIIPMISVVEGFKGPDKIELAGRIGTLRFIESMGEVGAVRELLASSFLVDFSKARTSELARASAAVFLAKLLSWQDRSPRPDVVVINDAEQLFSSHRRSRHSGYLFDCLVGAPFGTVFGASVGPALDQLAVDASAVRLYSSEMWNATRREPRVLPNMFVKQDWLSGSVEAFVPMEVEPRTRAEKTGAELAQADLEVERRILELVSSSEKLTRVSVVSVLSPEFQAEVVAREVDRLQREGCLAFVKMSAGTDSPSAELVVLESGRKRLQELRGGGESPDSV
ncbi:MAG: hypothetical protein JRN24_03465 [Nitrososphaerota archaeon]|nr:hypothetical protein [Nitrososphaerota archaeon]